MAAGQLKRVYFDKTEDSAFGLMPTDGPTSRFQAFPKVMYHAEQDPRTVKDKASLEKLGKGWQETPIRAQDGDTRDAPEE